MFVNNIFKREMDQTLTNYVFTFMLVCYFTWLQRYRRLSESQFLRSDWSVYTLAEGILILDDFPYLPRIPPLGILSGTAIHSLVGDDAKCVGLVYALPLWSGCSSRMVV